MPLVELARMPRFSQLEIGNIFDKDEIIVEIDDEQIRMATIRREESVEIGEDYDIRKYFYDIKHNCKEVVSINNNGYCEIALDDKTHRKYSSILTKKGFPKLRRTS